MTTRRIAAIACWAAAAAAASAALAAAAAPPVWPVVLFADLTAQLLILAFAVAAATALARRWAPTAAAALSCAVLAATLLTARGPSAERAGAAATQSFEIEVLHFNMLATNPTPERALAVVERAEPDVASLVEPPADVIDTLRSAEWRERYPYRHIPERAGAGWSVVLSKHPQLSTKTLNPTTRGTVVGRGRAMVIDDPRGRYAFVQAVPHSPRSPARWRAGNEQIDAAIAVIRDDLRPARLPIIAAGDFNASPTGRRMRRFRSATGLANTKPVTDTSGTYPATLPWPGRVAIDQLLVGAGVAVASYRVLGGETGSDHAPIAATLRIARAPADPNAPAGDSGEGAEVGPLGPR